MRLQSNLGKFDKVVERQSLHGLVGGGLEDAITNTHRWLKNGGVFCACEGMPWSKKVKQHNVDEMRLLEDRLVFSPEDIKIVMEKVGFKKIKYEIICVPNQSTRNWLRARGVNKITIENILNMRRYAPDYWKKAYNAKVTKDDVIVDTPWFFIKGYKP